MGINALQMDARDNVVTCVKEVKRGEDVVYQEGASEVSLVAEEDIPYCHKVALADLAEGTEIIKYGESLGKLVAPVKKGHWVNDQNLKSVPRDYESELAGDDFVMQAKQSAGAPDLAPFSFWGYRRAEGRPGIRNHVLILPTCACGSECCRIVASQVRGAVNIVFNTGCSDVAANTAMSQKVLTSFACNPNVYGVVIIGLGCETVPHAALREKIQKMTSKPVVSFGIQDEGGTLKTIEKAVRAARDMAQQAGMQQKELFPASELLLGIECGGSDATSGIACNPAVGELSDILVDMGASAMMSESIESSSRSARRRLRSSVRSSASARNMRSISPARGRTAARASRRRAIRQAASRRSTRRASAASARAARAPSLRYSSRLCGRRSAAHSSWIRRATTSRR